MKCFKCGYEMPPEALFCPHCGQNHDNTPHFCSKCGNPVDKTMKFCENCGAPIRNATKKEEQELEAPDLPGDEVLDKLGDIAETLQGVMAPKTHAEEIHNAKPAQVETPARSEMPAKPQTSTHSGGAAGGSSPAHASKMKRDSVSVRDAAAQQVHATSEAAPVTAPMEAPQTPAMATEQASAYTPAAAAAPAQTPASTPAESVRISQAAAPTQAQAPAVTQTAAPMQVQAPVSHAAPVAPHIPVAPVAPVASAAASVATEVAHVAGSVAVAGVKKAGSTAKTIAIWAAVIVFVIGAATACLNFFVPAPEDTVDKLIESVEELKYDDMLSCFDSTTEKQIRAIMGISSDLLGSLTGISMDLEDLMALAPSLAPYMEIPDLGIADAETVLYADCSKSKLMKYCETANSGGSIPTGYLSDNEIVSFLMEYDISLPGLENLIAEVAVVKITLKTGEVGYLPLINEGWGDWRIPMMDLMNSEGLG